MDCSSGDGKLFPLNRRMRTVISSQVISLLIMAMQQKTKGESEKLNVNGTIEW
jgi:hypothetical protein